VPTLPAEGTTLTLTFQNQATGNTTGGMSAADALLWDFEAVIRLTASAVVRNLSARTMLAAGHYWTLYSGSVSTTFVIADHSAAATYDTGYASAPTAFRPVFHATFWPLTEQWVVRYVGENGCKTQQVANTAVDAIALLMEQASPATRYTKGATNMTYGSRWTKRIWQGTAPPAVDLDHNLTYLRATGLFPHWDTDRVIPEATIAARYATWTAASKDLYDAGNWLKTMSTVGGRHDIGLAPGWVVWWLFTGDARLFEMAAGNADLAAAWPMHYRESEYGRSRPFQREGSADAGGRVLSVNTRPTLFLLQGLASTTTTAADKLTTLGTLASNGWGPDCSHQPDPFSFLYLLTGDYFYWEQAAFWAGWSAGYGSPANIYYGARGPAGYYGGFETGGEPRSVAWPIRSRARVAAFTPERFSEEKQLFTTLTEDFIAIAEGVRDLETPNVGTSLYAWGNGWLANKWPGGVVDPNHSYSGGVTIAPQNAALINWSTTYRCGQSWQTFFMVAVLRDVMDLGFATEHLLAYAAGHLTQYVSDPTRDPYYMVLFLTPHRKLPAPGSYFANWLDLLSGYQPTDAAAVWASSVQDTTHGYANIAMAAAASAYDETDGEDAWTWMEAAARDAAALARLDLDPKWALVPRGL
jgi:hypothetical protein